MTIKGELTDLNAYVNACRRNRFVGAKIKKDETERVYWECKEQKIKPATKFPVRITFNWYLKNKRVDPDNAVFGKKFLLDGFVMAGVLPDDSQKYIKGFSEDWFIDKEFPRTEIIISEICC